MADEKLIEELLEKARELYNAGRGHAARELFDEVLAASPENPKALGGLAMTRIDAGDQAGALDLLERAVNADPHFVFARERQIRILLARRDFEGARKKTDEFLAVLPDHPVALELLAVRQGVAGEPEGYVETLKKILAARPESLETAERLARALNPGLSTNAELWPRVLEPDDDLKAAKLYRDIWRGVDGRAPLVELARRIGGLADPAGLSDGDLPVNPPRPAQDFSASPPSGTGDFKGRSVMFGPVAAAGQAPKLARWLRAHGGRATTVDIPRPHNEAANFTYPPGGASLEQVREFAEAMADEAARHDALCLDFGSTFHYLPNMLNAPDLRRDPNSPAAYAELLPLKEKGVKIFFSYWGPDCFGQACVHHEYLRMLGFTKIPAPPRQTRVQYEQVREAAQIADAIIAPPHFFEVLPKTTPFRDICLEPEKWPAKKGYRARLERVLTSPVNKRKKNYDLILGVLNSLGARRPEIQVSRVEGQAHDKMPGFYAEADLGLDQAGLSFGLSAVEMMAMGLPILSRHAFPPSGSFREAAPVIAFDNIREFFVRLDECADDPGRLKAIGLAGREYVQAYHSLEAQGRIFGNLVAEVLDGGAAPQVKSEEFERRSAIWRMHPEEVPAFRYFDISVPLFCAMGRHEQALADCFEAGRLMGYRPGKFMAWQGAIHRGLGLTPPPAPSQSIDQTIMENHYFALFKDGKALLTEAEAMMKEAAALRTY